MGAGQQVGGDEGLQAVCGAVCDRGEPDAAVSGNLDSPDHRHLALREPALAARHGLVLGLEGNRSLIDFRKAISGLRSESTIARLSLARGFQSGGVRHGLAIGWMSRRGAVEATAKIVSLRDTRRGEVTHPVDVGSGLWRRTC